MIVDPSKMVKRTDVEFEVDGGVKLRGWLFAPPGEGRRPAITMAHGYAGVKEHAIEPFARAFAESVSAAHVPLARPARRPPLAA